MPYEQRICRECGATFSFMAAPSNAVRGKGQYCSRACSGTPSRMKPCATCGCEFRAFACNEKRGADKYCSRACRPRFGVANSNWRGGRITDRNGRVSIYAPWHPNPTTNGTHVYEYRLVAEGMLCRFLHDDEVVHHINSDPSDNSPCNLAVMTQAEHARIHMLERCKEQRI